METFIHKANDLETIKKNINDSSINGIEIDFQFCDGNMINTHNFYEGFPLIRCNWVDKRSYEFYQNQQNTGLYWDIDQIIPLIPDDKKILIDLKNWITGLAGTIINHQNPYLGNQRQLAELFWLHMEEFKNQKNILIQSYDHLLIWEIMKLAEKERISYDFDFGLIVRTTFQAADALLYAYQLPLAFLAIRYNQLIKMGGAKKICSDIKRPINIYGWFDIDDFYISKAKRLELIKDAKCDGYIK
ncbi:MAG TPA: hypothetical protein PLX66_02660 [Bacilli bacterium]|nr:hypothetical protein [Bacilli bacterium]